MIIKYDCALGSAKAIANILPVAIDQECDKNDIQQAAWGIAHLIEIAQDDLDARWNESVDNAVAAKIAERDATSMVTAIGSRKRTARAGAST